MGDEDKQFDATPQKLKKARDQGQVVKSKDFSMAIAILVMWIAIFQFAPFIWQQIEGLFINLYEQIPNKSLQEIGYMQILFKTVLPTFLILAPLLILASLIAITGDIIQVGPLFTITPLEPKLDKLNPTKYFKNLMSVKTLFELVKNIVKVVLLGIIGYFVYKSHFPTVLMLASVDNNFSVMIEFGKLMLDFIVKAGIAFLIIAFADYGVTKWKFLQDQKMSFKEIKDEYKNTEGDPHVKAALRQRRQQMLQKGMMDAVPDADFVVTNPTHIACALQYKQEEMESPKLVAKGTELFAKKIIEIARENMVPVIENPPVARAIFRLVDVNSYIPAELYKAVAEILLFVYNLRKNQNPSILDNEDKS